MKEALRPILSCALVVAVSAAVQGQLTDTKFEKYTRFLIALILLSLLITPMLNLLGQGLGDLLPEEGATAPESGSSPDPDSHPDGSAESGYTDALLSVLEGRIEADARAVLAGDFGLEGPSVSRIDVGLDGSDPGAIRVEFLDVVLANPPDSEDGAAMVELFEARYGCERVRVSADA